MAFVEYIVKEGDRWDTIAFHAYGDPLGVDFTTGETYLEKLTKANVSTVISPILVAGSRLVIPVLDQADVEIDSQLLPPWKR